MSGLGVFAPDLPVCPKVQEPLTCDTWNRTLETPMNKRILWLLLAALLSALALAASILALRG